MISRLVLIASLLISSKVLAYDKEQITKIVKLVSSKYEIDPNLVLAIIQVESGFNYQAVGRTHGEIGLMQLRPKYFPTVTFEPINNIYLGVSYLAWLKEQKRDDFGCAWFVSYNIGPNYQLKHPKLHSYFKKVIQVYPEYCSKFES